MDLQITRLDDQTPACQEALHNKIIIDYNKILKSKGIYMTMYAVKKFIFRLL